MTWIVLELKRNGNNKKHDSMASSNELIVDCEDDGRSDFMLHAKNIFAAEGVAYKSSANHLRDNCVNLLHKHFKLIWLKSPLITHFGLMTRSREFNVSLALTLFSFHVQRLRSGFITIFVFLLIVIRRRSSAICWHSFGFAFDRKIVFVWKWESTRGAEILRMISKRGWAVSSPHVTVRRRLSGVIIPIAPPLIV